MNSFKKVFDDKLPDKFRFYSPLRNKDVCDKDFFSFFLTIIFFHFIKLFTITQIHIRY